MVVCFFGRQGDTSVPATPSIVLDMLRQHLEEKDSKTISQAFSDKPPEFTEHMSVMEVMAYFTREIN